MDFWWGAVERVPGQYNWAGYKQALEVIKQTGLKVQAVLSFHACGGNVGDTVQIPLPEWVLQCGEVDPDLFFADRPRNGGLGNRNREYISIWADDAPGVLRGRSPMQCYGDFMASMRDTFSQELGTLIEEVVVGAGPCGELRLPSYVEANGWRFPGAGEFQCYDRRALASLAQAAREAGHPEWGYTGPHDAGEYNSTPEHTGFFSHNGSWNTPYGRFFLEWYSSCLLKHGERLLGLTNTVFAGRFHAHTAALHAQGPAAAAAAAAAQHSGHPSHSGHSGQPLSAQMMHSSAFARASTMSLNRILETGRGAGSGNGHGESGGGEVAVGGSEGGAMRPPAGAPLFRRPADGSCGTASASQCSAMSSVSTSTAASSLAAGCHTALSGAPLARSAGGAGSASSLLSPRMASAFAPLAEDLPRSSGLGIGIGPPSGGAGAAARGAAVLAACSAGALQAHDGSAGEAAGGTNSGSGGVSTRALGCTANNSGVGGVLSCAGQDTAMVDVEPSEASHTSTVGAELLPSPELPGLGGCSDSARQMPAGSALGSAGGPGPRGSFRSSAPTLPDGEPVYGQGTVFAAAAAAGVIIASSGGAAQMELCNSLSSLSADMMGAAGGGGSCGGGGEGGNAQCIAYLEVARSLGRDVDEESDAVTSYGTNAIPEDDVFAMGGGAVDRDGCLSSGPSGTLLQATPFGADPRRQASAELPLVAAGVGVAVAAAPQSAPSVLLMSPAASPLPTPGSVSAFGAGGTAAPGIQVALKIAGIHWWYRSRSHAAELTAGYYNVEGRDGYAPIVELCARHRANLVLTCVEMCDAQHPVQAQCGPEGLLRQLRQLAARAGVALSGENALPIFCSGGVDSEALDRVVLNMRACPGRGGTPTTTPATPYLAALSTAQHGAVYLPQHQAQYQPHVAAATAAAGSLPCLSYRMSDSGRMVPVAPFSAPISVPVQDAAPLPPLLIPAMSRCASLEPQAGGYAFCPSPAASDHLPALRAFTFLRLVPEILLPGYQKLWCHFMSRVITGS